MPIDRAKYHADWAWIATQIKDQAGWVCEWCDRRHLDQVTGSNGQTYTVFLTTAHLDQDAGNNDPANLRALCQRCHLNWDRDYHVMNRRRNRWHAQIDAGQELMDGLEHAATTTADVRETTAPRAVPLVRETLRDPALGVARAVLPGLSVDGTE